jgi:hypothetical protein
VFTKLGVTSRGQLHRVLSEERVRPAFPRSLSQAPSPGSRPVARLGTGRLH